MSYVSNYVILAGFMEDEVLHAINDFPWFVERGHGQGFVDLADLAGGTKGGIYGTLFGGGFNHFDDDGFIEYLRTSVDWGYNRDTVLIFQRMEGDPGWTEILLDPLRPPQETT